MIRFVIVSSPRLLLNFNVKRTYVTRTYTSKLINSSAQKKRPDSGWEWGLDPVWLKLALLR